MTASLKGEQQKWSDLHLQNSLYEIPCKMHPDILLELVHGALYTTLQVYRLTRERE
jgi:hypothetical protein